MGGVGVDGRCWCRWAVLVSMGGVVAIEESVSTDDGPRLVHAVHDLREHLYLCSAGRCWLRIRSSWPRKRPRGDEGWEMVVERQKGVVHGPGSKFTRLSRGQTGVLAH